MRLPRSLVGWTALVFAIPYLAVVLRFAVPEALNVFDWASAPSALLAPLFFRFPIRFFNNATGNAFAPDASGFLVFPSLPQLGVMLLFDVALSFAIAWVLRALLVRNRDRQRAPTASN